MKDENSVGISRSVDSRRCHGRTRRMSSKMGIIGLIGFVLVVGSLRNITKEAGLMRTVFATWQDPISLSYSYEESPPSNRGETNDTMPSPHLREAGVLLPVQTPVTTLPSSQRQIWTFSSTLDQEAMSDDLVWRSKAALRSGKGNSTNPTSRTEMTYPHVVTLGKPSSQQPFIWSFSTTTKSRSVYPMLSPSSSWEFKDDVTRGYSSLDSSDQDFDTMELRAWPHDERDPNCKPMHDWQSFQFPVCNVVHENDMGGGLVHADTSLVSTKGFWRHVWRKDTNNQTIVWKTFK